MATRYQLPAIVKAAERLLVDIEQAVRKFPRYHRYQIGSDLRGTAMEVYVLSERAWRDRAQQMRWVAQLRWTVDKLKQQLQVSRLLHAFQGPRQFEFIARQASELGAQVGGWIKSLHPKAQNAQGSPAVAQRGQKLSTCAASPGANR